MPKGVRTKKKLYEQNRKNLNKRTKKKRQCIRKTKKRNKKMKNIRTKKKKYYKGGGGGCEISTDDGNGFSLMEGIIDSVCTGDNKGKCQDTIESIIYGIKETHRVQYSKLKDTFKKKLQRTTPGMVDLIFAFRNIESGLLKRQLSFFYKVCFDGDLVKYFVGPKPKETFLAKNPEDIIDETYIKLIDNLEELQFFKYFLLVLLNALINVKTINGEVDTTIKGNKDKLLKSLGITSEDEKKVYSNLKTLDDDIQDQTNKIKNSKIALHNYR